MYAGNTFVGNISQHRIQELLEFARTEYDYVCIDCAPVLQSALTEHLALYTDIIVLIVLGDSTLFRDLKKAAELLVHLKVPAIASILNWSGHTRSISIDKLLDKHSEISDKIITNKVIQNIIEKVNKIIEKVITNKKVK